VKRITAVSITLTAKKIGESSPVKNDHNVFITDVVLARPKIIAGIMMIDSLWV
jgi:hypothetical protein